MPILEYSSLEKTERRPPKWWIPLILFLAVSIFEFLAFTTTLQAFYDCIDDTSYAPNPPPVPAWIDPALRIFAFPMVGVFVSWKDFSYDPRPLWTGGENALIWASVVTSIWIGIARLRRR